MELNNKEVSLNICNPDETVNNETSYCSYEW